MPPLEICVESVASADAALRGGADRLELCAALDTGGVTPTPALVAAVAARAAVPVMALIRCRPGDFVYSQAEVDVMAAEAADCIRAGAAGVVFGALTPDGDIDTAATRAVFSAAQRAGPCATTFHRAFDVARDPFAAFEAVHSLRADRLLTSGQHRTAAEGADLIRRLVLHAAALADREPPGARHRVIVMAGSGVAATSLPLLLGALGACDGGWEIHASARALELGPAVWRPDERGVGIGGQGKDGFSRKTTSEEEVGRLRRILEDCTPS